ncbi:ribosomal protein L11 methyltransferase [Rubritalea squalenifaciens DSM 18772]|uniref:Ribosomal protein L11 methyltransferase n=1 Tax=Rubritalea squalenifaciens DSM 18772 TaxID=1123071 RepID=A0A1M6RI60_9BACT|nr:50S ribosomal protein L11 methyltransferase [Rubritalea squalenifaciens]SHK32201.1 ribosomal protein L11 methyltransferase [Rubritalea squalenifaciens DSM 18772]
MWHWSKLSSVKWLDAWEERFYGNPNSVIDEIKGGKSIRVQIYCESKEEALVIQKQFGGSVRQLKMENWAAINEVAKPPLKIRDAIIISGSRDEEVISQLQEEYPKRHLIKMPAEMAFGTGDHATTSTCLRFLVDIARERKGTEWEMLDLGCGTSVLAIAAKMMGAKAAEAHDFDPQAVRVSKQNLKLNEIKGIKVLEKDVLKWTPERQWEVVAANLFSSILQEAFPTIVKAMLSGGDLVISGILKDQWEATKAVAEQNGLEFSQVVTKGKWVGARAKKR